MNHLARVGSLALLILFTVMIATASADDSSRLIRTTGLDGMHQGQPLGTAKASRDTVYLIGEPGGWDGQFELLDGNSSWHGWESVDYTYAGVVRWNVSNLDPINGVYSQLCGEEFDNACGFGYGNFWSEELLFSYPVGNTSVTTNGNIVAQLEVDTEAGFDFVYLDVNRGGVWQNIESWDGRRLHSVDFDFSVAPGEYVNGAVQLRFLFTSDVGWSDEDCLYDSNGGARLDDVTVRLDGVPVSVENFEDGLSQDWDPQIAPGVGDYAFLYRGLEELDICRENLTWQVAFIDDGQVVPGTGGSPCVTWCYGPGGYIVNCLGGLMGPEFHIDNAIVSPVMAWPDGMEGAYLDVNAYTHEPLSPSSPGMFWQWHVRSINTTNPADIDYADWRNRDLVHYSVNPLGDYGRWHNDVSDLLEPGRTYLQVQLKVYEYGWVWGYDGLDGFPAPYFDHVTLVTYPFAGPAINARNTDLAQDNFPERGDLDYVNLANNWVRWDMGRNIAPQLHLRNDPGDSIIVDIAAVRTGSELYGTPQLFYKMKANPLFDGVRMLPPGAVQNGAIIDGSVLGNRTYNAQGTLIETEFWFDLPDSDFFFPGDVIHYYLRAQDEVAGGDIGTTIVPADTAGYSNFEHDLTFNGDFIVRALPTMFSAVPGDQPHILMWNDFANYGGENEWMFALWNLGYYEARDFDIFYTIDPDGALGNGLGSRATSSLMGHYDVLIYTSGTLSVNTLANGDFNNEASPDLQLLANWFQLENRCAFLTGDDLVSSVYAAGAEGLSFLSEYGGVRYVSRSLVEEIDGQSSPKVVSIPNNSVFTVPEWIAYGGCPGINSFDVIEVQGTTERLAEFTNRAGVPGAYTYAAATYHNNPAVNSKVVLMPYDFMWIYNTPDYVPPLPGLTARALILQDLMVFFGQVPGGSPTDVPERQVLTVANSPNPFNPQTTITLNLPRSGHVSLKVYSLRGALVKTLVDGHLIAGRHTVVWDGTDNRGAPAASGVYFSSVRAHDEVKIDKMALVR